MNGAQGGSTRVRQGFETRLQSEIAPETTAMHDITVAGAVWRLALKVLGYAWATPTTLACLVLVLFPMWVLRQARPMRWHDGAWEWTVLPGSMFWRWYGREGGWGATTLGCCILFVAPEYLLVLAAHERRHVAQNLVLGPLFLPVYALLWLVFGYDRHPLERDARGATFLK